MKSYTIYVCEKCGFESRDGEEVRQHEAAHYGLTGDEMFKWKALKHIAKQAGVVISTQKNDTTDKLFDDAIRELMEFEKEHGLINR